MARILIYKDGTLYPADLTDDGYTLDIQPVEQETVLQSGVELKHYNEDYYASDDTNISIADVYNKILLTCELEEVEDLISSPLSDEDMYSPATNYQKYLREFISEGEGDSAINAFRNMTMGSSTSYDGAHIFDWYIRNYKSHNWQLNGDMYVHDDGTWQSTIMQMMKSVPNLATLVEVGKLEQDDPKDNTIKNQIDMAKYLVISVNGNGNHTEAGHKPSDNDLQSNSPCAVYTGNMSGGLFSPVDTETTNYIVISGDIVLNAREQLTANWWSIYNTPASSFKDLYWHKTWRNPQLSDNGDGAYYTQKYFDNPNPQSSDIVRKNLIESIRPYNSDFSPEELKYNYSSVGNSDDKLLKLPVIACKLKIGDKYCVEDFLSDGSSRYRWLTESQLPTEYDEDGNAYTRDYFTIGPNPAIGDNIIGKDYKIANNITPQMNIDAEGIAIPIKMNDKLRGSVDFQILGPVNTTWNDITRRHPTWFRSTKWYQNLKYVLACTSAIWIKDFEIKIYTDNGKINVDNADNDLVYFSDETNARYINIKDDIEFNISTALTSEECLQKGIKQSVRLNNPIIKSSGLPLKTVYNTLTKETGKPEEHYINNYYLATNVPKMIVDSTAYDRVGDNLFTHFRFTQFTDKDFYISGFERNVKENKIKYNLHEV